MKTTLTLCMILFMAISIEAKPWKDELKNAESKIKAAEKGWYPFRSQDNGK